MSEPIEIFCTRMSRVFGAPKDVGIMEEVDRAIGHFPAEVLDGAASHLIRTHKFKSWPAIADMMEACQAQKVYAKASGMMGMSEEDREAKRNNVHRNAKAWAANWMATNPLGRRAILEGWARPIYRLLVQKFEINQKYGTPDLENVTFPDADLRYFSKYSRSLSHRVDLHIIFGEAEGERWYERHLEWAQKQEPAR